MRPILFALLLAPITAFAEGCPPAPDHDSDLLALIAKAQSAPTENDGRAVSQQMWAIWVDAPDEVSQALLDRGMSKLRGSDFVGALQDLDRLVAYCPDYAEGYNQRAFVNYLTRNFVPALRDLDRAIARSPNHVAALSGRALTLLALGRTDDARDALATALALNPWLSERKLADAGGPLAPKGEDI
ncbi:MAG: tetratricopeptide repeat protein [Sedimentitalea sp.]